MLLQYFKILVTGWWRALITNTQMAKATGFGVSVVYMCNDFQASQEYTCFKNK